MTAQHLEQCTSSGSPKRRRLLATGLLLLALAAVAGTVAFTTQTQTAENVISFGNLKMAIHETQLNSAGGEDPVPNGHEVEAASGKASRIVRVQNVGSSDMYVRARPVMTVERADDGSVSDDELRAVVSFGMDQTGAWRDGGDGWWYYSQPVEASTDGQGQVTDPLMESVEFVGDFYRVVGPGGRFVFTVEAQAVQVEHNGESALEAQGWPAEGAQE